MKKQQILNLVIEQMQTDLEVMIRSAKEAKDFATDEESNAENKYDTKGLEASYLAGAQALRAKELSAKIEQLKAIQDVPDCKQVSSYALVTCELNTGDKNYFFILPLAGGIEVALGAKKVISLSLEAPLCKKMWGLKAEEEFEFQDKVFYILEVF